VDGAEVDSGSVAVSADGTTVELTRPWRDAPEDIEFRIHPEDDAAGDDRLVVGSRALSLGLWVEEGIVSWMEEEEDLPPFPLWARHAVRRWNRILADFASPLVPQGITDRIRLDRIEVVPDGSGPPRDVDTDLRWKFLSGTDVANGFLQVGSPRGIVFDQTIVLHELLHQRGALDIYAYRVLHESPNGSAVEIRDPDGGEAAGSPRMPLIGCCKVYSPPFDTVLMGSVNLRPVSISPLTAYGLDQVAGRRTPYLSLPQFSGPVSAFGGHPPGNTYLYDLPETALLAVTDSMTGRPLAGAGLDVFFDDAEATYMDHYPAEPQRTLETDEDGRAVLDLERLRTMPDTVFPRSDVIILRVRSGDRWAYHFLPVYDLNLGYLAGDREQTEVEVPVVLR
jgi:hypothetical protein